MSLICYFFIRAVLSIKSQLNGCRFWGFLSYLVYSVKHFTISQCFCIDDLRSRYGKDTDKIK